jgi:hypothetical protein
MCASGVVLLATDSAAQRSGIVSEVQHVVPCSKRDVCPAERDKKRRSHPLHSTWPDCISKLMGISPSSRVAEQEIVHFASSTSKTEFLDNVCNHFFARLCLKWIMCPRTLPSTLPLLQISLEPDLGSLLLSSTDQQQQNTPEWSNWRPAWLFLGLT